MVNLGVFYSVPSMNDFMEKDNLVVTKCEWVTLYSLPEMQWHFLGIALSR